MVKYKNKKTTLGRLVDSVVWIWVEYTKTIIREVFLLCGQFINIVVNLLLHVLISPGHYEQHIYKPPKLQEENVKPKSKKNRLSLVMDKAIKQVLQRSPPGESSSSPASSSSASPLKSPLKTEPIEALQSSASETEYDEETDFSIDKELSKKPSKRHFLIRCLKSCCTCFLLSPSLFRAPKKRRMNVTGLDNYSVAQKRSTGLLEDLCTAVLHCVDKLGKVVRRITRCKFGSAWRTLKKAVALFKPSSLLSKEGIDTRAMRELVIDEGYPFEKITVETKDGYLLRMDRIPKPESRVVVYFQHGILDSSHCWVANGGDLSPAFRAYDAGCDIFMGNFRGFGPSLRLKGKEKVDKDYWNYSINEHAFYDVRAFVEKIHELKKKELGDENFTITAVAHSLGGGAIMAYLVHSKVQKFPHHIDRAILLAPAGNHQKLPWLMHIGSYLLDPLISILPLNYIGFTSKTGKILVAKMAQDINNHPATRSLLAALMTKAVIGGETKSNPLQYIHNLVYHTLNGTSLKILQHFSQIQRAGKFQAFDYGEKKNLEVYGTKQPLCFLDHYDKIDIPIHILYGSDEVIIPPENILKHYTELQKYHPNTTFIKRFEHLGHLDITLGREEHVIRYLLNTILKDKKKILANAAAKKKPAASSSSSSSSASASASDKLSPKKQEAEPLLHNSSPESPEVKK